MIRLVGEGDNRCVAGVAEIVVATSNAHKLGEIAAIFRSVSPGDITLRSLSTVAQGVPEPEETGTTFAENARIKAAYYARITGLPCLADDSGLCVDALGGAPGVQSSRYAENDRARIAKLLAALGDAGAMEPAQRAARFLCVANLTLPDGGEIEACGQCEGVIAPAPLGESGFGYDPVFFLPQAGKTMAQLSSAEKNAISHRGRAMRLMASKIATG
jgi:XTP/dITP diphosphohydrolase